VSIRAKGDKTLPDLGPAAETGRMLSMPTAAPHRGKYFCLGVFPLAHREVPNFPRVAAVQHERIKHSRGCSVAKPTFILLRAIRDQAQ
jgi:hypothetical protein